MSAAESSELRRALVGVLIGIAFGALVGLLVRREPSSGRLGRP